MQNITAITNRLAEQLKRKELAQRAGQSRIAAMYSRLADQAIAELKSLGHVGRVATATLLAAYGLPPL